MKIVIVGGVAGGMSAAARLRRLSEDYEITVFERGGVCFIRELRASLLYWRGNNRKGKSSCSDAGIIQRPF
ncbi:MAG TPA: hypothetical protein ENN55_00720 [Firmicutes bacterium]|nr:hypothetical protein [Bacillota bacterium]